MGSQYRAESSKHISFIFQKASTENEGDRTYEGLRAKLFSRMAKNANPQIQEEQIPNRINEKQSTPPETSETPRVSQI